MILTRAQIAAFEKAQAVAINILPRLEHLRAMARVDPRLQPRVEELEAKRRYLHDLAEAALEFDRQLSGPDRAQG